MATTSINGLPYPAVGDSPNGPLQIQNLAQMLDTRIVPRFATAAARDVAIPSPIEGQLAHVAAQTSPALPARLMVYSGSLWRLVGPPSLPAVIAPWTNPAGDFGFDANGYQEMTRFTLPDPGFPYRVDARARGEIGAVATSGTRVDMQLWLQLNNGTWVFLDTDQGLSNALAGAPDAVSFQQIKTGLGNVTITGTCDVVIRAYKALGPNGTTGRVTAFYRSLTASQWAA